MSLADELNAKIKQVVQQAGEPMESLARIALQLKKPETAQRLRDHRKELEAETFTLMVLGRFKTGKSTFLNALLGRLTHPVPELPTGGAPLPVNDLPTTATLTSIRYRETPRVRVWTADGKSTAWSLKEYLDKSSVRVDAEETRKFFRNIRQFELEFPAELCKAGVTLMDSPGTDDSPERDMVTRNALARCDAAIVVYRSDPFAGITEREFVEEMKQGGVTRYFTVVNMWSGRKADDTFKHFVWDRLVTEMQVNGPKYTGQDFQTENIYFVDAAKALEGKLEGDPAKIEQSGLGLLERRLSDFLRRDRLRVHVERFVQGADSEARMLENAIGQLIKSTQQDQQLFRLNYEKIQPKLADIRARKNRLPRLFDRYRKECHRRVQASFDELIRDVRATLSLELIGNGTPEHPGRPIPSLNSEGGLKRLAMLFVRPKVCREAEGMAIAIVKERRDAWLKADAQTSGPRREMDQVIDELFNEIRAEIKEISRAYADAHYALSGFETVGKVDAGEPGLLNRVTAVTFGVLTMNPDVALGGGTRGWSGVGRAMVGHLAIGVPLVLLGAPFVVPGAIAGGLLTTILWNSLTIEKEIKEKVVEQMVFGNPKTGLEGLRGEPDRARPALERMVDKAFNDIQKSVTEEVDKAIDEEESGFRDELEANSRDIDSKKQLIVKLDANMKEVAQARESLRSALFAADQS